MGEIDTLKKQLIGHPVPYITKGEQACRLCDEINQVTDKNGVPPMQEAVFQDGDKILFRASRKAPSHHHGGEDYYILFDAYHARHDGEYADFKVGSTRHYYDVIGTAILERRGVDFGRLDMERLGLEYHSDPRPDALTLTEIEIKAFSGPDDGEEEQKDFAPTEPPDPLYKIRGLPGFWPKQLQHDVAEWVDSHQ